MKHLVRGLLLLTTRKDGLLVAGTCMIFCMIALFSFQNGKEALVMFSLDSFSFVKRFFLFLGVFFDFKSTFTVGSAMLALVGSFLGGINIALAYLYIKIRGERIFKSGLYSGLGLILAFLGVGCAACGTAFLSVILSFLGFSTMLEILPYKGQEIGYVGIVLLFVATYTLAKKVTAPLVC